MVDSSSPRYGEKASYYSAVCLETGEVEWMELEGNSNSETSAVFLEQLRERHHGRLNVIWDNAPAPFDKIRAGEAVREYLRTPGLGLRLVNLPGYNPDFNADEAAWGWVRAEATGNLCLGTRPWYRRGSAAFSPTCPAGGMRSSGVAGPSCNQGPEYSCETSGPFPDTQRMHIPSWPWFKPIPMLWSQSHRRNCSVLSVLHRSWCQSCR